MTLFRRRDQFGASTTMALVVAATVVWQFIVLDRDHGWMPWIRYTILIAGIAAALLLLVISRPARAVGTTIAVVGLLASLGGSAAFAVATSATSHTGAIPSAGPASAASGFGSGRARGNFRLPANFTPGQFGTGGANGTGTNPFGRGGAGGLLGTTKPSAAVVSALKDDSSKYKWVAAALGSTSASGYQLYTGNPVMPIGGFNGSDPSPTLAQFQSYVTKGQIHYFIAGGGGFGQQSGGSNVGSQITSWVKAHYEEVTIGGLTMYDCTQPTS